MTNHVDRRAHIRESIELPARVMSDSVGSWPAQICDLSVNGAKLLTTGHIVPNEHLTVVLDVRESPRQTVRAGGTARRVVGLKRDTRWGCAVAVEFDAPLGDYAESFVDWLEP